MMSSRPPPMELASPPKAPGTMLGNYQLVLRVAVGGMGEIWAGRVQGAGGFEKLVAVKTILPELSYDPNFERMFLDEAELASRIRHPNVVQVLDVGEEPGLVYQVMEWVAGQSLWAVVRAGKGAPVPLEVAARIIYQTCAGIHAAHELKDDDGTLVGLVHRDVSPQNVLITPDGSIKVVDFGVAKYAGKGAAKTQQGELKGKVPYMAPEHILGKVLDRKADVFALAVIFYQMVSGKHPFLRDDDLLTLAQISSEEPAEPLIKLCPTVPLALSDAVGKALSKKPEERTQSALAFQRAIASEVRTAALESSNRLVSEYLVELMGEKADAGTRRVKAAIKRIDAEAGVVRDSDPSIPDMTRPSELSVEPSVTDDEPVDLPVGGAGRAWTQRNPVWFALGGAAVLLAVVIMIASMGSSSTATEETASESVTAKPATTAEEPAKPPPAKTAQPEPTATASAAAQPGAGGAAAQGTGGQGGGAGGSGGDSGGAEASAKPDAGAPSDTWKPPPGWKPPPPPPGGEFMPPGL